MAESLKGSASFSAAEHVMLRAGWTRIKIMRNACIVEIDLCRGCDEHIVSGALYDLFDKRL